MNTENISRPVKATGSLLKEAFIEWQEDNAQGLAAGLAFFIAISLSPTLIIVVWIAGLLYGEKAAKGQIVEQLRGVVGENAAELIQEAISLSEQNASGTIATIIGTIVFFYGALRVFAYTKDALNFIWAAEPKPKSFWLTTLIDYALSFVMVLLCGGLLLASLLFSAIVSSISVYFEEFLSIPSIIWQAADFVITFSLVTVLFAMIYKILPDVRIAWSDVWRGAAFTALLFAVGQLLIGLYLGHSSIGSTYGAAGALVVVLFWLYYSAQIFFFGAELTEVYANHYGSRVLPQHAPEEDDSKEQLRQPEEPMIMR